MFKHINGGTKESMQGWNIYRKVQLFSRVITEDEAQAEFKGQTRNGGSAYRFTQKPEGYEYEFTAIVDSSD